MKKEIKSYFDSAKEKIADSPNVITVKMIVRQAREFQRAINASGVSKAMKKYTSLQYQSLQHLANKRIKG